MRQRTETDIIKNWRDNGLPLVSIVCITYNQEQYITDAIEGFLLQETDFPFEIVIQDDASTDMTPEIIKKYAKKYPKIIKPVFQHENQFSQPRKNVLLTAFSFTKGEYIAVCEGDDYWIDSHKLQIQISEMKKNPKCDVSFHPVLCKHAKKKRREKVIAQHSLRNEIFITKQLVLGAGGFCPTASFVFKSSIFKSIPEWFLDVPISDYFLQILASLRGGALYVNKVMAVYRVGSLGSWSERIAKDESYAYTYFIKILKSLDEIDFYTCHQFIKEFNIIRKKVCFFMCRNPVLSLEKRKQIFALHKNKFNFINKIMWYLVFRNTRICKLIYDCRSYFI